MRRKLTVEEKAIQHFKALKKSLAERGTTLFNPLYDMEETISITTYSDSRGYQSRPMPWKFSPEVQFYYRLMQLYVHLNDWLNDPINPRCRHAATFLADLFKNHPKEFIECIRQLEKEDQEILVENLDPFIRDALINAMVGEENPSLTKVIFTPEEVKKFVDNIVAGLNSLPSECAQYKEPLLKKLASKEKKTTPDEKEYEKSLIDLVKSIQHTCLHDALPNAKIESQGWRGLFKSRSKQFIGSCDRLLHDHIPKGYLRHILHLIKHTPEALPSKPSATHS